MRIVFFFVGTYSVFGARNKQNMRYFPAMLWDGERQRTFNKTASQHNSYLVNISASPSISRVTFWTRTTLGQTGTNIETAYTRKTIVV